MLMRYFILNRAKKTIFLLVTTLSLIALSCREEVTDATVELVRGQAFLVHDKNENALKPGDIISEMDSVKTGVDGIVLVSIQKQNARLEIQPNSLIAFSSILKNEKILNIRSGNLWFKLNHTRANEKWFVKTPTSVAGIRGTKIFTFQIGDMFGTCHCEGDVEFSSASGDYFSTHHKDYLTISSAEKTIVITDDDSRNANIIPNHNHSVLENSPLGPKVNITDEEKAKLMRLISKKMK